MSFDIEVNHCAYCGRESDEPYCSKECWDMQDAKEKEERNEPR